MYGLDILRLFFCLSASLPPYLYIQYIGSARLSPIVIVFVVIIVIVIIVIFTIELRDSRCFRRVGEQSGARVCYVRGKQCARGGRRS